MEGVGINLSRIDYAQVGTTSKHCLKLLTTGQKGGHELDKVVVGSHNGVITCIARKKNDTQDKIFVAAGNQVKGFSKKGKQFFAFETNMTEPVLSMYIYGVDMFLCGKNTFNHYHDCADANYFLCGDQINDVLCLPIVEGSWVGRGITPVIACADKTIKVINGSELAYEVPVGGNPNVLHLFMNNGGLQGQLVFYGTKDGKLGLLDLPANSGSVRWEQITTNGSSVTAMHCYNITGNGGMDLILGKDDGTVEIYTINDQDKAQIRHSHHCEESITGLQCGRVSSSHYDEVVICTYTGWLIGLTTEPIQRQIDPDQTFTLHPEMEIKVHEMQMELEELQGRVEEERQKYHELTMVDSAPPGSEEISGGTVIGHTKEKPADTPPLLDDSSTPHVYGDDPLSAMPLFAINDRFSLSKEDAAYTLSIELIVPIDYVLLQCDVPVDLLDVDKNNAVVSVTECEPNCGNALLATYRCQANTTRLEMKVRSIEGQYGTLQAYVSPRSHPKMCQVRHYAIKPLSLHQRTHTYDAARPQNVIKMTGQFSMAEAHSWATFSLPELPEKVPPTDTATFSFQSTFVGTQLECTYSKGMAQYRSDNLSTIAILRDVLSKEITRKKLKVDISCHIADDSVPHTLQLLHPKLEHQLNVAKKVHLAEALKELQLSHGDMSFLSEDFADILSKADQMTGDHKAQTAHLERIYGVITDLYIDKFKFIGVSVKHRVDDLLKVLDNYSHESLVAFFQARPESKG